MFAKHYKSPTGYRQIHIKKLFHIQGLSPQQGLAVRQNTSLLMLLGIQGLVTCNRVGKGDL